MHLTLDESTNQLVVNGTRFRGTRRWEVAVLAALIEGGHHAASSACTSTEINSLLASRGQTTPLTRKQWSLIWGSLEHMFQGAQMLDGWSVRLCHAPRSATVGPWWWNAQPDDQIEIKHTAVVDAAVPLPRLAADESTDGTAALCQQFLVCQSLISEGQLEAAAGALGDEASWRTAAPELQALRHLRWAEVERLRRNFDRAYGALDQAAAIVSGNATAAIYLASQVSVLRHRIDYARDPTHSHSRILTALVPQIRRPVRAGHLEVDNHSRGLLLNLAALSERRWLEQNAAREPPPVMQRHIDNAMQYWAAALFGFLVTERHNHVHNMCSNIGYCHQRLCDLGLLDSPDTALQWYALAQAWHNRFDLPDDTVWEYIFIGDFWLQRADVRAKLARRSVRSAWAGRHPSSIDFYDYSVKRALEIGDPRQVVHTALNLWRFGVERRVTAVIHKGRSELEQALSNHPDLAEILRAEGYVLP